VTLQFGVDATPIGLLGYLWILAVAGYYTFRPGRERQVVATAGHQSMAAGMPATR